MNDLGRTLERIAAALERMADAAEAQSRAARMLTEVMQAPPEVDSPGARFQQEAERAEVMDHG